MKVRGEGRVKGEEDKDEGAIKPEGKNEEG